MASALAVKAAKAIVPNVEIGCMINQIEAYAHTTKPEDQLQAVKSNQLNMFYPDVQARGYYPSYIYSYFAENNLTIDIEPEDAEILKTVQ